MPRLQHNVWVTASARGSALNPPEIATIQTTRIETNCGEIHLTTLLAYSSAKWNSFDLLGDHWRKSACAGGEIPVD